MLIKIIKVELRQHKLCSFCYDFLKPVPCTYQTQANNNVNLDTDLRQKQDSATEIEFRDTFGEA